MAFCLFLVLLLVNQCVGFVVEVNVEDLQQEIAALRTSTDNKLQQLEQTVAGLRVQLNAESMKIGFTAQLSQVLTSVGQHQHIVFDFVPTNFGSAYDKQSGHFTAPVAGMYYFSLTLTSIPNLAASLSIIKNGADVAHCLADVSTGYNSASTSIVLSLAQNDQVWIQNEGQYSSHEEVDGGRWSSFSGFLLRPL